MANKIIVVFVEGQSEEKFYSKLCRQIQQNEGTSNKILIRNLKGIGNYENKAHSKLKHEIIPKYKDSSILVFLCYDTDVFDIPFQQKPPVNWKNVEKKIKKLGLTQIFHIKAKKSIEDWFLKDFDSLSNFLKLKKSIKTKGNCGYQKISWLFKQGNKVYQKGYNVNNFVETLNYEHLADVLKDELSDLISKMK